MALSAFRVDVKITMTISNIIAFFICIFVQKQNPWEIGQVMMAGFSAQSPEIGVMLDGGGIVSMVKVFFMVSLSSAYSGIFKKTGLLNCIKGIVSKIGDILSPFGAMLCSTMVIIMVVCSQTLAINRTYGKTQNRKTKSSIRE